MHERTCDNNGFTETDGQTNIANPVWQDSKPKRHTVSTGEIKKTKQNKKLRKLCHMIENGSEMMMTV